MITITFNPAVDYVVTADTFRTGKTNRTKTENIVFGGKGVNVSLLLHALNTKSIALGFIAGFTGKALREGVEKEGITTDFIEVENGYTRINLKLHAEEETELNGSRSEISENEAQKLFESSVRRPPGNTLELSGSVPKSLPKRCTHRLQSLRKQGVRLIGWMPRAICCLRQISAIPRKAEPRGAFRDVPCPGGHRGTSR